MRLDQILLEIFFPPKCCLCRTLLKQGQTDLCPKCRAEAPAYPGGKRKLQFLDSFVAVWYYEGNVRRSLLRFKFYGARNYARNYGRLLAMRLQEDLPEGFDVLTWVPVSRLRRFRRGYDQVELLARSLGKELGIRPVPVLKKIRHNRQQSRITEEAKRRANVLGVYQVTDPQAVRGRRVLLLDDILTTGATVGEAARLLKTEGAEKVYCGAIAAARKH